VADIICLALWTGQRQKDRLSLTAGQLMPQELHFRQSKKHGQPLLIPMAATLATRMQAKAIRRAKLDQARAARRLPPLPQVMLDEKAGKPFAQKHYQHVFRDVVLAAAHGIWRLADGRLATVLPSGRAALKHVNTITLRSVPQGAEQILPPCPSLLDFRDQDLRDTAVTWLARAGAQELEIAAITGHSLKTIKQILEHYFGLHPDLARRAINKLSGWHTGAEG
jgi:integrase